MTDKELKKLSRSELLELMLEQSREIDRLQEELAETKEALQERFHCRGCSGGEFTVPCGPESSGHVSSERAENLR